MDQGSGRRLRGVAVVHRLTLVAAAALLAGQVKALLPGLTPRTAPEEARRLEVEEVFGVLVTPVVAVALLVGEVKTLLKGLDPPTVRLQARLADVEEMLRVPAAPVEAAGRVNAHLTALAQAELEMQVCRLVVDRVIGILVEVLFLLAGWAASAQT